jgi:mono/diheme cytochrome c family protein
LKSFFILFLLCSITACKPEIFYEPIISLDQYQIEEGFELHVAASEPFIEAPVTMDFDNKGRMWVVEMRGYMQNLEGTGDDMPNGVISILEDFDHDGITDHSQVFLDSLVLPRAIAHVYGGLLYAEPPNLWFVDIEDDKPKNKILVDSLYSDGGNVEHQPNGLMMHIDNWIYNAKSNFRYQRKNKVWVKEPTWFRGQWGISKDNFGRLYYNDNSTQLIGDYVLPNTVIKNEFYKPEAGLRKVLTPNQNVFPLHPTSVNRGYVKGVLDKDSLLINVTSACGPLIYRGNSYPKAYLQNAFVCAPEANLVKRNILSFEANKVSATQAIPNKEFIASTDEGFRPVNLFNGPDGNMYVVDMHRGIIQDKAFLSPYLYEQLQKKQLDTIVGMGRILKVVNINNPSGISIDLEKLDSSELVDLLDHDNGWLRDKAQQLLIYRNDKQAIPLLKKILEHKNKPIAQIHALYTLNGLNALDYNLLETFIYTNSQSESLSHAFVLLEQFATSDRVNSIIKLSEKLILKNSPEIDFYILSALGAWMQLSVDALFPLVYEISNTYKDSKLHQEGLVSSLSGLEDGFLLFLEDQNTDLSNRILMDILNVTISNKNSDKKNFIYTQKTVGTDARTSGYNIYRNFCATCHGINGEGIDNLAPPLQNSEYISKSSERLALVILHGLSGPIHVNGKLYKFNVSMPGLAHNPEFKDEDVNNIIKYVTSAFSDNPKSIELDKIKVLREHKPQNPGGFNEEELLQLEN